MTTHCHPDEWTTRVQLAACYRIFAMLGWTEMIYNHITVRVPTTASGDEKQFLINPFGLHQTALQTRHRHTCCGVGMHHTMRAFYPVVQCGMHHKTSGVDAVFGSIQHFAF